MLLCALALVALHHAFDVDGLREMFIDARRESPESRSPEQNAAIATWGRLGPVLSILDTVVMVGLTYAYLFFSNMIFFSNMTMSPESRGTGPGTVYVLPLLAFPMGPVNEFMTGFRSGVPWSWGAAGLVLYHFTLWTAVAWLGLRRLERRPLKP